MAALDNCDIVTFEKRYVQVNGAVKLKNVRQRIEQQVIMDKLKYGS